MAEKTNFNMQITTTQKDIMDFMLEAHYDGRASKAAYIWELIYNDAMDYLHLPAELKISDEVLFEQLLEEKKQKDSALIEFIGKEKYEELMKKMQIKEDDK